eukprot:SAG31_NODE_588_length_13820_cov_47.352452_6_plen_469_part_00
MDAQTLADLTAAHDQLAAWQSQPDYDGVVMVGKAQLADCVTALGRTLSLLNQVQKQQQARNRIAADDSASVAVVDNPIDAVGNRDEEQADGADDLASLDPDAIRLMRLGVHPASIVLIALFGFALSYFTGRAFPVLHPSLMLAGWTLSICIFVPLLLMAFILLMMRGQLKPQDPVATPDTAVKLHALFLEPVKPAVTAEMAKMLKTSKAFVASIIVLNCTVIGSVLYFADLPTDAVAAGVLSLLFVCMLAPVGPTLVLPTQVSSAILADKATRLANRIQNSPRPVPADAFLRDINSLHAAVQAASTALAPMICLMVLGAVDMAAIFLVLALGPGPPPDHWLNADLHYRDVCLGVALFFPLLFIYIGLAGPGKVTAACDEVAAELNALRNAKGKLAPVAVLERVEALERYVDGTDLGFGFFHYRISYVFIYNCISQLIAIGTIVFPMLITQMNNAVAESAYANDGSLAK